MKDIWDEKRAGVKALNSIGLTNKAISKKLKLHPKSVARILRQIKDRNGNTKCNHHGKPSSKISPKNIRRVKEMVRKQPVRNLRAIVDVCQVSRPTAGKIVKAAGLKSLATIERPLLSKLAQSRRVERCQRLLDWFGKNSEDRRPRSVLYSDEKVFVVDAVLNRRNRRILAPRANLQLQFAAKTKHPASTMVFGLISSDGNVMPPIFIEAGVKINGQVYRDLIIPAIVNWCKVTYGDNWSRKVCLMQDGATPHTAKATQDMLREMFGVEGFWSKQMWPPSSPELNPLDFWV